MLCATHYIYIFKLRPYTPQTDPPVLFYKPVWVLRRKVFGFLSFGKFAY